MYYRQELYPTLRSALGNIHRDPGWWRKVLVGGALLLSGVGWPLAEGFQIESYDNIQRGFPFPLPRWTDWGTKLVIGTFGLVIDFFFVALPIFVGGITFLCGTLAFGLFSAVLAGKIAAYAILTVLASYLFWAWWSGASALSKLFYAREGDIAGAMQGHFLVDGLRPTVRSIYGQARLRSLPFYVLALVLAIVTFAFSVPGWLQVLLVWLVFSIIFYARLVTAQLYAGAAAQAQRQAFERAGGR